MDSAEKRIYAVVCFRFGWFVALLLLVGCGEVGGNAGPAKPPVSAAEADFDWTITRLERALESFRPAASAGLRVERKLSYELIPPNASRLDFTARITIASTTAYRPTAPNDSDEPAERGSNSLSIEFDRDLYSSGFDRVENDTSSALSESTGIESKVKAPAPTPKVEAEKVYRLAYLNGAWHMESILESEQEQRWFEYALQR